MVGNGVNWREMGKMGIMENSFKFPHDLNIIQQKYNIVEITMTHQNIFLDEETYLKRNHSHQELILLQNKQNSREIARFFTSKESDMKQMREVVSHQIQKVIENLPSKYKPIVKGKFQRLSKPKTNKSGKFQQSVKYSHACSSKTEADHELLDFFDHRVQITDKYD